jgi:hypothetical protein
MPRKSARPHPPLDLAQSLEVARSIADHNAGRPMNRILLAEAMRLSPSSSGFRDRIMASGRYGLTDGNYNSELISLTSTGVAVTRPRNESERVEALRTALSNVEIFQKILNHFGNAKLPATNFLKNTIEREPFGIDPEWSAEVAEVFTVNAKYVGYLREMNSSMYLVVDGSTAAPDGRPEPAGEAEAEPPAPHPETVSSKLEDGTGTGVGSASSEQAPPVDRELPMQVFVAHGRTKKPLEQLKQILNEWQVPFVVAVDEAHAGRPISEKVADLMRSCTAGIFIFSADDEFKGADGEAIFRPSQNVIYELGAASLLYGRKIVVFKELGVTFPTDFSDLGWIEFQKDALDAKAMDLLRELIALKAIKLVSTASR